MGDMAEIFAALGRLEEQGAESQRQRSRLFKKVEDIQTNSASHGPRLDALENTHDEDVKPVLEDYKKTKAKGFGVLVGLGLVAGGLGANIGKAIAAIRDALGL